MGIRIRIVRDEDFDRSVKDWAEELQEETRAKLDSGEWDAYGTIVKDAHCDRPCVHDKELGSLWGSVTASGQRGTCSTISEIEDEHLRSVVRDLLEEHGYDPSKYER
jgi:hypothetical protein